MSVPKKQQTKSASRQRRSHNALKKINLSPCPKCKKPVLPHTVCLNCGTYKGRQI
ncbi:50S ribosomal protein L32, partial [Candidatus Parcubacteria bacterium]|nr:50S ribosomal protein L32 [Candidatus Parcubacteria bacterium]